MVARKTIGAAQQEFHTPDPRLVAPSDAAGMSRFLLNIEKRSLSWLTLCGVGLASKNAM
jgi:hypothetical protein